jgi:hypothetical protein
LSRRNEISEKSGMHITAFFRHIVYIFTEREKAWDLRAKLAGRLQISCLGDFYGSLPLSAATQRQRWKYPKSFFFVYTRLFVIVMVRFG